MRYFIRLSYNGAPFCGWQIQKNGQTIQQILQDALSTLLKEVVEVIGAGRTDTGVNAINYYAHAEISPAGATQLRGRSKEKFIYKLNAILPHQIKVFGIYKMHPAAHARFDAVSRTYKYFITTSPNPFNSQFTHFVKCRNLDIELMNQAAQQLLGTQDFSSLQKVGSDNKTTICTVTEAFWSPFKSPAPFSKMERGKDFVFTVTADHFLRNMVRAMVGSLLEVGTGKRPAEWIAQMLRQKDRCSAGGSVPGNALFLTDIKYPYKIY